MISYSLLEHVTCMEFEIVHFVLFTRIIVNKSVFLQELDMTLYVSWKICIVLSHYACSMGANLILHLFYAFFNTHPTIYV